MKSLKYAFFLALLALMALTTNVFAGSWSWEGHTWVCKPGSCSNRTHDVIKTWTSEARGKLTISGYFERNSYDEQKNEHAAIVLDGKVLLLDLDKSGPINQPFDDIQVEIEAGEHKLELIHGEALYDDLPYAGTSAGSIGVIASYDFEEEEIKYSVNAQASCSGAKVVVKTNAPGTMQWKFVVNGETTTGAEKIDGNKTKSISWDLNTYGPHSVSAWVRFTPDNNDKESIEDSKVINDLTCGEAVYSATPAATCDFTKATVMTNVPGTMKWRFEHNGSIIGNGEETINGNTDKIIGLNLDTYGPHNLVSFVKFTPEDPRLKTVSETVSPQVTCGEAVYSATAQSTCKAGEATVNTNVSGTMEWTFSVNGRLYGPYSEHISSDTVHNQPFGIDGTYGPHEISTIVLFTPDDDLSAVGSKDSKVDLICGEPFQPEPVGAHCINWEVTPSRGTAPLNVVGTGEISDPDNQIGSMFIEWGDGQITKPATLNERHVYGVGEFMSQLVLVNKDGTEIRDAACQSEVTVKEKTTTATGQYQDFIGSVPFGAAGGDSGLQIPVLEEGKEYFDMTVSVMLNVEFYNGVGEVVYRFNGRELDDVTTSIFFDGGFEQVSGNRAQHDFGMGTTVLKAYRFGNDAGTITQTNRISGTRWIKPLDMPFEHKYNFPIQIHGPANMTDTLAYNEHNEVVEYDENGLYTTTLTFNGEGVIEVWSSNTQYPETGLYINMYGDMKFKPRMDWIMPVDGSREHDHEFHADVHRDEDGNIVIEKLYLSNGTTSVAQQFPYGRHDGAQVGVTIVGIPNVSMIAFCQRPGVHEVVYWGGWENESYYLPDRGWIFDQDQYDDWNDGQRADCIDAAERINQKLAQEGLRTDHTFAHHGQRSQGYQLNQKGAWSAYNLVGMRPPHIGQILKPGTVLGFNNNPNDMIFKFWDLENAELTTDRAGLESYVESLGNGNVEYVDNTGIHPADAYNR